MILYHGTSESHLKTILRDGLVPRSKKNRNSNWDHTVKSRLGHVYLTSAYAFYFAHCAAKAPGDKAVVLEIDLDGVDETLLYPDEDFIGQALQHNNAGKRQLDLLTMTKRINLEAYQRNWSKSLEALGNLSYKGTIAPERIRRVAIVDTRARIHLVMNYGDPSISIMNFMVMRGSYQGFLAWIFGDRPELPGSVGMSLEQMEQVGMGDRVEFIRKESADRSGIEVRKIS